MTEGHSIVIGIDPGFGGTGVGLLIDGKLYAYDNVKPSAAKDARYAEVASKCARIVLNWISDIMTTVLTRGETYIATVNVVVESPHAMGGAAGHASLMRGDVFTVAKLAGSIGTLLHVYITNMIESDEYGEVLNDHPARKHTKINVHYPEVRVWKGQVSKETTKRRVLRDVKYAIEFIKEKHYKLKDSHPDHIYDAVGLAMWFATM